MLWPVRCEGEGAGRAGFHNSDDVEPRLWRIASRYICQIPLYYSLPNTNERSWSAGLVLFAEVKESRLKQ